MTQEGASRGKEAPRRHILLWRLFYTFFRIGGFTIGGGYAMLPLIERDVVTRNGWVDSEEFLDMIAIAQSAPGVLTINSAIIVGYKIARMPGALVATLGAALPSFIIIVVIASFFIRFGQNRLVESFMRGARPAVVALLFYAAYSMGRKGIKDIPGMGVGLVGLVLLAFLGAHPILVIIMGGVAGYFIYGRSGREH